LQFTEFIVFVVKIWTLDVSGEVIHPGFWASMNKMVISEALGQIPLGLHHWVMEKFE